MNYQTELDRLTREMQAISARNAPGAAPINPQIAALLAAQSPIPTPTQAPEQTPLTIQQIESVVQAALKNALPQLFSIVQVLDGLFEKALSKDDLEMFKQYRDARAPGLKELLESDTLHPIAQLLWETIKEQITKPQGKE